MSAISPDVDPSEVGLDPVRLAFVARHFDRYVADRRLPGFLAVVTRGGKVAYVACRGFRDLEKGLPLESDTHLSHLLDDQADHFGGGDDLLRGRADRARRSGGQVHPRVRRDQGLLGRVVVPAGHGARLGADQDLAPDDAHGGPHLRLDVQASRRCHVPLGRIRVAHAERPRPCRVLPQAGEAPPVVPAGQRSGTTRWRPTCSAASSRWRAARRFDAVLRRARARPARDERDELLRRGRSQPSDWPFSTARTSPPDGRHAPATWARRPCSRPSAALGGSGLVSTAADYHRFTQMLLRRGELDGVRLLGARTVSYMTRNHLPGGAELARLRQPDREATRGRARLRARLLGRRSTRRRRR